MHAHPHRGISAGISGILLALSAMSVGAADPVDPTAESIAVAAMLLPTDVTASATTNGLDVFQPDDFPEFTENGGLRAVSQTIYDEGPVELVYDFRWQFPDAASAKAFLDAAEPDLGEIAFSERRSLPASKRPVQDTRLYRFEDTLLGTGTVGYNYLMRLDNLVAKVYVSQGEETKSSGKLAAAIAEAAAARMTAALAGETPSEPPILRPTPSPEVSPSPMPTAPTADAAVTELLSHVPAAMRDGCAPDGGTEDGSVAGVVSRVSCHPSDAASIMFVAFESVDTMDAAYDSVRTYARTFGSVGSEGSCAAGGYEGIWTLADVDAGRIICLELGGDALVAWSYPDLRILSLIDEEDADWDAATELWLNAGPE
jgi:hypothetical protein